MKTTLLLFSAAVACPAFAQDSRPLFYVRDGLAVPATVLNVAPAITPNQPAFHLSTSKDLLVFAPRSPRAPTPAVPGTIRPAHDPASLPRFEPVRLETGDLSKLTPVFQFEPDLKKSAGSPATPPARLPRLDGI